MKFILSLLFFSFSFKLFAQNVPKNPLPFSYTAAHFNLIGLTRSIVETDEGDDYYKREYSFNKKGYLLKEITALAYKQEAVYTYDFAKKEVTITKKTNGEKFVNKLKWNSLQQLVESGSSQQNKSKYIYNKAGLLIEKRDRKNKVEKTFEYNNVGQLTKETLYNQDTVYTINGYYYSQKNNTLVVEEIQEIKSESKKFNYTYEYNQRGLLTSLIDAESETQFTYEYDTKGNWIIMTINTLLKKTNDKSTSIIKRKITYY